METKGQAQRGSAKLFALEAHDHEGIARALGAARDDYTVKWWWKYGQPAIDLIKAEIEVSQAQLGRTLTQLMTLNEQGMQVTASCFPYGIPKPEVFRLQVDIRQNV